MIQPVIDEIKSSNPDVKTLFVQLDLADSSSVRAAAKTVNETIDKLDVLINNAGSEFPFSQSLLRGVFPANTNGYAQSWH